MGGGKHTELDNVPIFTSYDDHIRPLLDAVDKLRLLKVTKEGIQLPTIVVVGDQSSGKSSVLESLAGISLPRGQGICTRVPLIMRLQHHAAPKPELSLEFKGKKITTDESKVAEAINLATDEIAGNGKGISNNPLTLVVKKHGVPDLTMVDLPGITRVPVHGQPENIYEQVTEIIMEYINPEESIILNVLSATVDFATCESIRMSQKVDKTGRRTLAVVTKADKAPEGLLEKVTADDVNIGLGYVCVRNRIGDESYEGARKEEALLFNNHPLLSRIDKSMVGIPVLAQKLSIIQATIIARCLPGTVRKIDEKLNGYILDLNKMPLTTTSPYEVMSTFMGIIGSAKESLRKILLRGEYEEYPNDKNMHCVSRLVEMLNQFFDELGSCSHNDPLKDFLMEEIQVLEESKGIQLPNFLPHTVFQAVLWKKVEAISVIPVTFVEKVCHYVENSMICVVKQRSQNYQQLQSLTTRAGHCVVQKMKEQFTSWVMELVEKEKITDYTCSHEYVDVYNKLISHQHFFIDEVQKGSKSIKMEGLGEVEVSDYLRNRQHVLSQAFDLKMRMVAYWKIVLRRIVDSIALHLRYSLENIVNKEFEKEIFKELMVTHKGQVEKMLAESPSVAIKREKLKESIKLLKDSKEVLSECMDKITLNSD
ncbi:dynamin-related protein 4C-like [Euphorbia lathyris]|uniref:dynamin-related protein 4C-like n=1 Tax=Euphorbia lathyris TaxID=212925 RepID=UPI003313954F